MTAPPAGGRSGARPRPSPFVWLAAAAVVAVGATVYLRAYRLHHMQPVGWDVFGYVWQTRAVGHASLSAIGTRPGVPLLASLLRSVAPLAPMRELVVVPIVLAVALALAAAAAVRTALGLHHWILPLVVAATLLWPGTGRTLAGYEASLLLLVLLAAASGVLTQAGGHRGRLLVTAALFLAAALTHLAIFAAFVAVVGVYFVLSLPGLVRDRRAGVALLATDAGAAGATVLGAGATGAAILFGALGFRPGDTLHTDSVSFLFRARTITEVRRVRPWTSGPAAALGAAAASASFLIDRPGPANRPGRAILRLGFAWLAVAGAAVLASLRGVGLPGGRFLLFALPLPIAAGLGLGAMAWLVAGGRRGWRAVVGVVLIAGILAGLARPGYRFIQYQFTQMRVALTNQLGAAGAYVATLPATQPVVVIVDQPGPSGAYTPKLRLNVIRTAMPLDRITSTFVYVGRAQELLAGRPTILPATQAWLGVYDQASRQAWAQVEPALARGAAVLMLQKYDAVGFDALMASDPSRQIAPGVYVLRGPVRAVAVPPKQGPFPAPSAALWGLWILLVLGAAGWGFADVSLPRERASALDVACLAPAVGAGGCVLAAFVLAAAGFDPSGPLGVVALCALAAGGFAMSARRRRECPAAETSVVAPGGSANARTGVREGSLETPGPIPAGGTVDRA